MASWTSTSPISGSVWDGPTGSPIISPSNWQRQVLDNLTVLANHNHSGSAGEGQSFAASFFPSLDNDYFSPFFPTASSNNWSYLVNQNSRANGLTTSACGASVAYDVHLRHGTYTIKTLWSFGGANPSGIPNAILGGSDLGLGTSTAGGGIRTWAGVSVSAAGEYQLAFRIGASRALSTVYNATLGRIAIWRTGS